MNTQTKERAVKLRTRSSPRAHSAPKKSKDESGNFAATSKSNNEKNVSTPTSDKIVKVQNGLGSSCNTHSVNEFHVSNQNICATNEKKKHAELNKLKDCLSRDTGRDPDTYKRQLRSYLYLNEKLKNEQSTTSKVDSPVSTARRKIGFGIENYAEIKITESRAEPSDTTNGITDSEEFAPRRKKLRSEVTDEELWEGFQTVRFKRLTPIKFRSESTNLCKSPKQSLNKKQEASMLVTSYDKISNKIEDSLMTLESKGSKTDVQICNRTKSSECRGILGAEINIEMAARDNENKPLDYRRSSSKSFAELCKEFLDNNSTVNENKSIRKTKSDYEIGKKHNLKRPTLRDYLDISNTTLSPKEDFKVETLNIKNFSENIAKYKNDKIRGKTKSLLTECSVLCSPVRKTIYKPFDGETNLTAERVTTSISSATRDIDTKPVSSVLHNNKDVPVTPKRSARLQEKRECTPIKYQSNADYIYTPLKRSEEPLKNKTVHKQRKSCDCSSISSNDRDSLTEITSKNVKDSDKLSEISAMCIYEVCSSKGSNHLTDSSNSNESAKSRRNDSSQRQFRCEQQNPSVERTYIVQSEEQRRSDSRHVTENGVSEAGSLKIRVRKTESGASIVSTTFHSTNSDEYADDTNKLKIPKYTRPAQGGQRGSDTPNTRGQTNKIISNKQKNPTTSQSERKDPLRDHQTQEEEVSPKKQTRSRTRSGEGEITLPCADPEAGLKQARNRGKVHPSEPKSCKNKTKVSKSKKRRTNEKTEFPTVHTSSPQLATKQKSKDSEEERLLKLPIIGKYACLLWSSENKRHFQQAHPDSSSTEVEEIMRQAWQKLTDKEKIKYYQRAFSATREENRHSIRKCKPHTDTKPDPVTPCKSMVKFLALKPVDQHEELRKWLRFVHEVSPEEYTRLVNGFKEVVKGYNLQGHETVDNEPDNEGLYHRKLLFQKVLDVREKVLDIYHQKKAKQKELVKDAFGFLVKRLISGEEVNFSDEQHSDKLASVLIDLRNLENEFRVTVSGEPLMSKSYENLLEQMQESESEVSSICHGPTGILDETDIPEEDTLFFKQYLDQVANEKLPVLDSKDVLCYFDDVRATLQEDTTLTADVFERLSNYFDQSAALNFKLMTNGGYGSCCELDSPSCILTNWLISEQFKQLSQGIPTSYRNNKTLIDSKFLTPFFENQSLHRSKRFNTSRCKSMRENFVNVNKNNNANAFENASRKPLPSTVSVDWSPAGIYALPDSESVSSLFKHSVIQRKIENIHGQTVVRYTSTPLANDQSDFFHRFSKFNRF